MLTFAVPRRVANVSMPPLRSPSTSGRSLVAAMTMPYTVMKRARNATCNKKNGLALVV